VGGIAIRVVQRQEFLADWGEVGRVGVVMTIGAVLLPRRPVVLTKPGTIAKGSEANPVLEAAVAPRATDRIETSTARRAVDQHGKLGTGAVAGIAIAIQHDVAMDVMEIVFPGLAVTERSVGRGQEISVT
jgi:hypothetical protein